MRQYVVGVDGGGTKTHYTLFDSNGNLVYFLEGGPANHEVYGNGYEGTRYELKTSFQKIFRESGLNIEDINFSIFGMAGIDVQSQKDMVTKVIAELGFKDFEVMNDAFLGIKAASSHGYGVCSINGTGTCCAGIDPQGSRIQVGGTGYFFGDEGGATHLGGMAFRCVYDYLYRCGQPTLMKKLLFDFLRINKDDDLVEIIYQKNFCNNWVDFSRIPFEAANLGDEVALELLQSTGRKSAKSVLGAIRYLNFESIAEIDIILAGSVYVKGENPALVEAFRQEISSNISQKVRFTVLQVPPVTGAVLWALESLAKGMDQNFREQVILNLSKVQLN
ncbi:MAG TPA: N-acetylglucosamine kinase [Firmicutes bacterium]|jgi:N-acetylglucosamine kinase-like BadF-type ATPase|nr:N-acetylglucosamine kinase [Bacillota bacterium]